ncbi:MAG: orotate phosphoribosyltransferase [Bacteroidales bacterium]|jgi:orotate phosphoribosyltransferase|nr:orotate phosphoribosyltransferase [Bacteroidales bacterium]
MNNVAEYLLQIKAVKLNNQNPFTWASGRKSPIYCDNRVTLSYPEIRTYIRDQFVAIIREKYASADVIAGVATGGIAQGALVAQILEKPFVYIRAEEKKHGMHNRIEGHIAEGQKVVVIEDLVSTGKSSLLAVDALREANCEVLGMVAIFTYTLQTATDNFEKANVQLDTLTDYPTLLKQAVANGYVTENDLASLNEWSANPEKWSNDRM